jgi:hypothetical protein
VAFDGPNDGSRPQVVMNAASALPFRANHLSTRVFVRRGSEQRPWCQGARMLRLIALPEMWECHLGFDLPDKGALRAVVVTGPEPPEPNVAVHFVMPSDMQLRAVASDESVSYLTAGGWVGLVQLQNMGDQPVFVTPLVRLDGEQVAYRVVEEPGPVASAYRLRLTPHQVLTLRLDLSACRVSAGRRELQVYLDGGAARTAHAAPLDVSIVR